MINLMYGYKKFKEIISIMYKIYSKQIPDKLLHIVNRQSEIVGRTNVCDDNQFMQLATLRMQSGQTFKPHKHIWKPTDFAEYIAQESWVVIKGSVLVSFYDLDGQIIAKHTIYPGDCSITFEGGHTYLILEDDTVVYEYKTGPYHGQQKDKVFI